MDNPRLDHANVHNLVGRRFGRLLVTHRDYGAGLKGVRWVCRCDCGAVKSIAAIKLSTGNTVSCGCYVAELRRKYNLSRHFFVGKTFGRLTVVARTTVAGSMRWQCACSCGGEKKATTLYLKQSRVPSCGCAEREAAASRRFVDLSSKRFCKLVVNEHLGFDQSRKAIWFCVCDCGRTKTVRGNNLTSGRTISCGCARRDPIVYMTRGARDQAAAKCATRRARKRRTEGSYTANELRALFALQRGKCANCSRKLPKEYHKDHIAALANGGTNFIWNIQLLCEPCHRTKGTMDPIDWAQKFGRLL
jgi:hypothetical protein